MSIRVGFGAGLRGRASRFRAVGGDQFFTMAKERLEDREASADDTKVEFSLAPDNSLDVRIFYHQYWSSASYFSIGYKDLLILTCIIVIFDVEKLRESHDIDDGDAVKQIHLFNCSVT